MLSRKIMRSVDLGDACRVAVDAAEAAGELIRVGLGGELGTRAKDATGDLITDLDLAAESLIVTRIQRAFPDHRILAEEAGLLVAESDVDDDSWCWLVDPLDGTNNVAIGLHACAVGIALCHNGLPVLGVVRDPIAGQTWSAVLDKGAFGPGGLVRCPPYRQREAGPVLAWVQGYGVRPDDETARALRIVLEQGSRRLIQMWAPLLCWVMLARGDIDGFVGYRAGFVDLPAGLLLAREAGVAIRDFDGRPLDDRADLASLAGVDFVAGHPEVIADLLVMVKAADGVTVSGVTG
jgi:myo-inositol-1(or 4)-monophosphatase